MFNVLKKTDRTMSRRSTLFQMNMFQKSAIITICVTFLLIFIGGLVRASGAGLGCPDWPRCFGLWVPPLSAVDLPAAYDPEQFNVFKTWMEYVNRLVGVIVGFLVLLTFSLSTRYIRRAPSVFWGAAAALILVLFQGWLGGQVVKSGLSDWMITVHMVTAIVILNILIWSCFRSFRERIRFSIGSRLRRSLITVLILLIAITIIQVVFGTQVRETLEAVKSAYPALDRGEWVERIGLIDTVHRSFSWLVLGLGLIFHYMVRNHYSGPYLPLLAGLTIGAIVLQIAVGAGLVYLGIPPVFQVFHLWIASFAVAVPFLALLIVTEARTGIPA